MSENFLQLCGITGEEGQVPIPVVQVTGVLQLALRVTEGVTTWFH